MQWVGAHLRSPQKTGTVQKPENVDNKLSGEVNDHGRGKEGSPKEAQHARNHAAGEPLLSDHLRHLESLLTLKSRNQPKALYVASVSASSTMQTADPTVLSN